MQWLESMGLVAGVDNAFCVPSEIGSQLLRIWGHGVRSILGGTFRNLLADCLGMTLRAGSLGSKYEEVGKIQDFTGPEC